MKNFWLTLRSIVLTAMGLGAFFILLAVALTVGSVLMIVILIAVLLIYAYKRYDTWRRRKRGFRHRW